jgi:membrane-associated phospholipid phosphatase
MMQNKLRFLMAVFIFISNSIYAQKTDTSSIDETRAKKRFYHTRVFKATICPALLIGWGVSTIHGHGLYSSYDVYKTIHTLNISHTHADNYLQFVPLAEFVTLSLLKVKRHDDLINTGILIIKSGILTGIAVEGLKHVIYEVRPDSLHASDRNQSFPSAHTAVAFMAATLVYKEFKDKSIWYGVGAYTAAAGVGVLRMVNNLHWESDVFVGAGLGILSVNLVYLTHKYKWGKKGNALLVPSYYNGSLGVHFVKKL